MLAKDKQEVRGGGGEIERFGDDQRSQADLLE